MDSYSEQNAIPEEEFSFAGFQVVRGEFFAHTFEPSITFNGSKLYVNMACLNKLPTVEYVQILVNQFTKKLVIRPCREDEKDSFRWCSNTVKRKPKQVICRVFFAKLAEMMQWDCSHRYKLLGKLISANPFIFVFRATPLQELCAVSPHWRKSITNTATTCCSAHCVCV